MEASLAENKPSSIEELVLVLDFGAQYTQLIARRVRECNVYCEIIPFDTPVTEIAARSAQGNHTLRRPVQRL